MSDVEIRKAADEYWSATLIEKSDGLDSYHLGVLDAFEAGVKWARAQWPITPRTAEEAGPSDMELLLKQSGDHGAAIGRMWEAMNKKLDELSIWCGALEGQANRIDREQRAMIVDVGQKVEAVISLVDDLDELIRSEGGEAIEVAREDEEDEAYRPAVGMFGIGGDASVVSLHPAGTKDDAEAKIADLEFQRDNWKAEATRLRSEGSGRYEYYTDATDAEEKIVKRPAPTLRNVLKAIEDVRALAVDAGISFDFTISTEA